MPTCVGMMTSVRVGSPLARGVPRSGGVSVLLDPGLRRDDDLKNLKNVQGSPLARGVARSDGVVFFLCCVKRRNVV